MKPTTEFKSENLQVNVYAQTSEMGRAAAEFVSRKLADAIKQKGEARMMLVSGTSQFSFLPVLRDNPDIKWKKITVFHLNEYLGMSDQHPASFRKYLRERILDEVKPKKVHFLEGDARDVKAELEKYETLLKEAPIDIACIGIGENGHIAFIDPPVADFDDPKLVKIVELDDACRMQQMGEGWFRSFDQVPTHALSLTIPAIMQCETVSCVVPDERKAEAIYKTLNAPIDTSCPATILRKHKNAVLWLDKRSAMKL